MTSSAIRSRSRSGRTRSCTTTRRGQRHDVRARRTHRRRRGSRPRVLARSRPRDARHRRGVREHRLVIRQEGRDLISPHGTRRDDVENGWPTSSTSARRRWSPSRPRIASTRRPSPRCSTSARHEIDDQQQANREDALRDRALAGGAVRSHRRGRPRPRDRDRQRAAPDRPESKGLLIAMIAVVGRVWARLLGAALVLRCV